MTKEWISVDQCLPPFEKPIKIKRKNGSKFKAELFGVSGIDQVCWLLHEGGSIDFYEVTHWKPIEG